MKKHLGKALVCLLLTLLLLGGAVVPVAAASIQPMAYITDWRAWMIDDNTGSAGDYLPLMNVATEGTAVNGTPVTLYHDTLVGHPTQQFAHGLAADNSVRLYTRSGFNISTGRGYTLNAYRTGSWPCTVYMDDQDNRSDSEIDLLTVTPPNRQRIKLVNPGLYLYTASIYDGAQLYWGGAAAGYNGWYHFPASP